MYKEVVEQEVPRAFYVLFVYQAIPTALGGEVTVTTKTLEI